jgi:hypothetical protein
VSEILQLKTTIVCTSELSGAPADLRSASAALPARWLALGDTVAHDRESGLATDELQFIPPVYHQNFPGFESDMSILDLLFNKGPETHSLLVTSGRAPSH